MRKKIFIYVFVTGVVFSSCTFLFNNVVLSNTLSMNIQQPLIGIQEVNLNKDNYISKITLGIDENKDENQSNLNSLPAADGVMQEFLNNLSNSRIIDKSA